MSPQEPASSPLLSRESAETVRATLPAVAEAVDAVSELFYRRLFAAHPELPRDLFNRGNQAVGTQPRALAGSVAAYATALVTPGRDADALLTHVAHKHASLGIAPAQYRIVHAHLFAALTEVLGDAATEEVVAAWDEVYWRMARTLMDAERALYARHGFLAGATWRPWEVVERVPETAEAVTFRVRPADGRPTPRFTAGQYVSVQVQLPDGARQIRQYSLTGAPDAPVHSFAVKRERPEDGVPGEVSHHLYDQVREGSTLSVSAPFGDLVLDADTEPRSPLLFASAGIGCAPFQAMFHDLLARGHRGPVLALHADRSPDAHALRAERERLVAALPGARSHVWYERHARQPGAMASGVAPPPTARSGRMDLTDLTLPEGVRAYLCGPLPFMRGIRAQLRERGVPARDIRYEMFGPDLWLVR